MLPLQFFGQNIHFAISLFAALVFFAVFWLYFDAWTVSKEPKELIKCSGFLLVSLSFLLYSTVIEQSVLGKSLLGTVSETVSTIMRFAGYLGIVIGQIIDPLQEKPKLTGLDPNEYSNDAIETGTVTSDTQPPKAAAGFVGSAAPWLHGALPLSALAAGLLYWRRATTGLERHLKPIAIAFFGLFAFEVMALAHQFRDVSNPTISRLVASFGPLWIAEQVLLLLSSVLLGLWVWRYLTTRFLSQLFMIFTTVTLAIFLTTAVTFTYLLGHNIQQQSLSNLRTATNVLQYALDGKKAETLANANVIAENPDVVAAVQARDNAALTRLTKTFLRDKQQSSLIITSVGGQVLLRAEDPARYGDSMSSNTLVRRALIGQSSSTISTRNGVLAPLVYINSATPMRDGSGEIVGTVTVGLVADNAFVDGIKHSTGLDSAVYAGNIRTATTFVAPDGVSRLIGVKDTNSSLQTTVLKKAQVFSGTTTILNRPFLAVYQPLKDVDNTVIGMLFIGETQTSMLQTVGRSIELTFLVTALLLVLAIVPAYFISKYLAAQLD